MSDGQPTGFFNRASVVLFLVFTIPAALTIAGVYYVALQGRVPGGEDSACVIALTDETDLQIEIYDYVAGLVRFETQTASIRTADAEWQILFSDTMPLPQPFNCENAVTRLDERNIIIKNQKSLAWSDDNGLTWQSHHVCDDPRPISGRCDAEALSYAAVDLNVDGSGMITVIQSAVDDFGEPQRDADGHPIVDEQWQLQTTDAGRTWLVIATDD
ncbi:MAG: hypothetical protein WBC91_20580 [Phototrophicaceae bacterium]